MDEEEIPYVGDLMEKVLLYVNDIDNQPGSPELFYNVLELSGKDRENADGTSSWRCDQKERHRWSCKGRVRLGATVEEITQHTCVIDPARVEVATAITVACEQAVETREASQRIIAQATVALSHEARAISPKNTTIQRQLARDRRKAAAPPPAPARLADINIPVALTQTKTGDLFLLYDSAADDPERFFIYATEGNLEIMGQNMIQNSQHT
uniref:FLYWCH-type domain-containing protein n=1 Tax=Romanomermis culicivorax TaxID=13658 RepID=A0A915KZF7_ROMCU